MGGYNFVEYKKSQNADFDTNQNCAANFGYMMCANNTECIRGCKFQGYKGALYTNFATDPYRSDHYSKTIGKTSLDGFHPDCLDRILNSDCLAMDETRAEPHGAFLRTTTISCSWDA